MNRLSIGTPLLAAALLIAAPPVAARAQMQPSVVGQPGYPKTRAIQGIVETASGAPAPGAVVLLKDAKTLQVRSFIATDKGAFHFYGLSTEVNWQLRAEAGGFTSKIKTISVFDSHQLVNLDLKLDRKFNPK